jgi:DNA polymerase-1
MPPGQPQETLYLLDAHALIFQVFHAIGAMTSPSGVPTNALFGFTRDLLYLRNERRPDYLLCAFDRSEPTFRDRLFPQYKAQRAPMPDDLRLQIEPIHQLLEAMRVPVLSKEGYEADDVIATVATAGARKGLDVYICSTDKDCRQLLSDRVQVFNLRKREVFDRDALMKEWGVTPEQVVDLQTLVGDAVDNVPGVPGIGVKTAAKLLQDYGTLGNLLAHVDDVPGEKRRQSLRDAARTLDLGRQLVTLATDVPIKMDWKAWRLAEWDAPRLLELFRAWGFHRFADQVMALSGARRAVAAVPAGAGDDAGAVQGDLFSPAPANGSPSRADGPAEGANGSRVQLEAGWHGDYALVDTAASFDVFLRWLGTQHRIAIDLETTSLEPRRADVVGYAVSWQPGRAWYLAVRGPEGAAVLDPAATLARLRPVLEDGRVAKVNQNIKYDLLVLRQQGVHVAGVAGDPMIADYLLHAGERNHNMQSLARAHLQHEVIPITDLIGKGKHQLRMDQVPPADVAVYSGEDADVAWRLSDLLEAELERQGLRRLYDELEVPLIEVLAEMEFNGIRLDVPRLRRLGEEMAQQLAAIEQDVYKIAGREFNIASLKQLRQVMFDELKLPVKRRTGITGEASTDQETLEWLAEQGHELPRRLVEHRKLAKLKGTYVDALPALVNPQTGRVHASFNQTVAATGRLSSSDPNLQNVPIRTEEGGQIRQAFLPAEGWTLLTADYSQIELRLLAHFSGDEELRRAFAEDRDVHTAVAAQIFGVPEKDATAAMRRVAKTVNFGVIYGMSDFGLAQRLHIPREEAARFIEAYFARYPKVLEYQDRLLRDCRRTGYVATLLGRRRAFDPTVLREGSTYKQRSQAEREAINMEIQGSAADLIKVAMLAVYRRLKREGRQARLLLQIHDELVFEVPPAELADVGRLVADEMTGALASQLQVPLKVDLAAGLNWLDTQELRG